MFFKLITRNKSLKLLKRSTNNHKKEEYGRFNLSPKMKAILNASEGFFVDSGGCRKYFKYCLINQINKIT